MKRQVILLIVAIIFCLNGTAYATWENDLSLARNAALPTTTDQTPLGKLATDILVGTNPISESCKAVQQNYSSTRHKAAVQIAGMIVRNRKVDQEIRQTAAELHSLAHISATFSNTSTASKQLLAVMKHPYHEAKKRCDKSIIELEHELRQVGRELEIEIAELSKKVASPKEEDKDQAIKTNLLKDQKALALVRDTISYIDSDSLL